MRSGEKIVVFDVETGGLNPARHPIIQFAALAMDHEWKELEALELKIQFDVSVADAQALEVNHYDPETWKRDAVTAPKARQMVSDFFRRHSTMAKVSKAGKPYKIAALCGHNARFDGEFLAAWFKAADQFCPAACYEALCTVEFGRWLSFGATTRPENHKLETLCSYYGIELTQAHDALSDVRATAALARHLYRQIDAARLEAKCKLSAV